MKSPADVTVYADARSAERGRESLRNQMCTLHNLAGCEPNSWNCQTASDTDYRIFVISFLFCFVFVLFFVVNDY